MVRRLRGGQEAGTSTASKGVHHTDPGTLRVYGSRIRQDSRTGHETNRRAGLTHAHSCHQLRQLLDQERADRQRERCAAARSPRHRHRRAGARPAARPRRSGTGGLSRHGHGDLGAAPGGAQPTQGRPRAGCSRAPDRSWRRALSRRDTRRRANDGGTPKPRPPGAPAQSARARGTATSARVVSRRPARGGLRYRVPRHLAQAGARVRVARSHPHAATAPAGMASTA